MNPIARGLITIVTPDELSYPEITVLILGGGIVAKM